MHAERVAELEARVLDTLAALHAENPLMTTHDRQKALARLDYVGDEQLLQAVADRLIRAKKLVGDARRVARADFKPKLSANQRKLKDKIVAAHAAAGFAPPEPKEFANQAGRERRGPDGHLRGRVRRGLPGEGDRRLLPVSRRGGGDAAPGGGAARGPARR